MTAVAYTGVGNHEKAEECCLKEIAISPSAMSWIRLAGVQIDREKPIIAIRNLEHVKCYKLSEVEQALFDGYLAIANERLAVQ